jgi:hypothetical protein
MELKVKRRPGRKVVWTEERILRLLDLLRSGMSRVGACRACGLGESSLYMKMDQNQEFRARVQAAESESEAELLEMAKANAKKDGRVAIQLLERRFPEQWGSKEQKQHTHVHTTPQQMLAMLVEQRRKRDLDQLNHQNPLNSLAIPAPCVPAVLPVADEAEAVEVEEISEEPGRPGFEAESESIEGTQADPLGPQHPTRAKSEPPSPIAPTPGSSLQPAQSPTPKEGALSVVDRELRKAPAFQNVTIPMVSP